MAASHLHSNSLILIGHITYHSRPFWNQTTMMLDDLLFCNKLLWFGLLYLILFRSFILLRRWKSHSIEKTSYIRMDENTTTALEEDGEEKKDDVGATPQSSGSSNPAIQIVHDDAASSERELLLLSRRLDEVEKERDLLKQALEHSEDTNAQLKAENAKLQQQHPNIDSVPSSVLEEGSDISRDNAEEEPNIKQQQQQGKEAEYKIEIKRLQTKFDHLKEESEMEIAALKTEIVNLQESEASLIETKERLASRIKDLLADTINSKMFGEYFPTGAPAQVTTATADPENLQQQQVTSNTDTTCKKGTTTPLPESSTDENKLNTTTNDNNGGAKEQSDLIAVAALKKNRRSGFMKINPFADNNDDEKLDYGYKIPMPTEEEFAASEFLGKDVYVPSESSVMNNDNDSQDSFEVSLELDDEQQADLIRDAADRKKSFFDKLFGE